MSSQGASGLQDDNEGVDSSPQSGDKALSGLDNDNRPVMPEATNGEAEASRGGSAVCHAKGTMRCHAEGLEWRGRSIQIPSVVVILEASNGEAEGSG
ncbi:MAG TPA: hypothetical protein VLH15_00550 [Dehalococcoidales bacterium]|nr:hypothetical protein [Dehalococcoidales bacterium]